MTKKTKKAIPTHQAIRRITRRIKMKSKGLFPEELLKDLKKEGATNLDLLSKLGDDAVKRVFSKVSLDRTESRFQQARLKRFQKLTQNGKKPGDINGLVLDMPDKVSLSRNDLSKLRDAKIESLDDWISKRSNTKISNDATANLDTYARFYAMRIDSSTAAKLVNLGYSSAHSLAKLSTGDAVALAKKAKVRSAEMASIIGRAQTQASYATTYIGATHIYANPSVSSWIDDLVVRNPALTCIPCAEEESAFSYFAYYVYLVQKTRLPLGEVEKQLGLNIELKKLSPLAEEELLDDPKAPCSEISLLDYIIRLLQELLDKKKREATNSSERASFEYLSYPAWRAEKIAAIYPETKALWQNDVLTSLEIDEEQGSILLDRAESRHSILSQINKAKEAISNARVDVSNAQVPDAKFEKLDLFTEEPFYDEYLIGLQVLEQIIMVDDLTQEARIAGQNYEHGIALSKLEQASQLIDLIVADVFPDDSAWYHPSHDRPLTYEDLIDTPPTNKKQLVQLAFDDLMTGRKTIFQPRENSLNLDGLLENGNIDLDDNAWSSDDDFDQDSDGTINFSLNYQDNAARKIKYTRGDDDDNLEDYGLGFDFEMTEGGADQISIEIRRQQNPPGYYRLRVHPQAVTDEEIEAAEARGDSDFINFVEGVLEFIGGEDEGLGGYHQYLVLEKISIGKIEVLGKEHIGYSQRVDHDASIIQINAPYRLSIAVDGPELVGRLVVSSNKIVEVRGSDIEYDKGTFGLSIPAYMTGKIWNFEVFVNSHVGYPPFHASNQRMSSTNESRMTLMSSTISDHGVFGHGMSDELLAGPLVSNSNDNDKVRLYGVKRTDLNLYMVFKSGSNKVEPNNLNKTLHRALAQLMFLRFAVIPIRMAQAYYQAAEYERSAELLRLVYDDTDQDWFDDRGMQIFPIFSLPPESFKFGASPDARLMRLRLAEAYLAQGEVLFRADSKDSKYRAYRLFERVIELHDANCDCESSIGQITEDLIEMVVTLGPGNIRKPDRLDNPDIRKSLDLVRNHGLEIENLTQHVKVFRSEANTNDPKKFATAAKKFSRELDSAIEANRSRTRTEAAYNNVIERSEQIHVEAELRATSLGIRKNGKHSNLFGNAIYMGQRRLSSGQLEEQIFNYPAFCVPQNPLKSQQVNQACLMIQLLKNCFNILGFKDDVVPPYRFEALLAIANDFTQKAQSAERDLQNFRQLFEQESFALLQAEQNLALSNADVSLEALNVDLATGDQNIAILQSEQTSRIQEHYASLIAEGLSESEKGALFTAVAAVGFSGLSVVEGGINSIVNVAMGGAPGTQIMGGLASTMSAASSAYSLQASYERREQEWKFNEVQAQFSEVIAQLNVVQSERRLNIAKRRQDISLMRRDFSLDSVNFLSRKFLNGAMYAWMIKTIREQYRTRLNYAIAAAYMAERALAFEIQNKHLDIIRFDYFDPTKDGLLGATQLLTDLGTLQNTHFRLATRKLQLSKTLSLSQLFPVEFAKFKESGILPFSTAKGSWSNGQDRQESDYSLQLFDRDFPGHYMRLIKSVKISVLALVPPIDGIKATLRNSGLSSIVVGPPYTNTFKELTINRQPDAVALTAPFNSDGLFVLDYNDKFLLPFEGNGVATDWIFELPKPSNHFNFDTIFDVFVTLDYTSLESNETLLESGQTFRQQVVSQLNSNTTNDKAYSLKFDFPDAWYHLNNPQSPLPGLEPMEVEFFSSTEDFPTNHSNQKIKRVTLLVARADGTSNELNVSLKFTPDGRVNPIDGGTTLTQQGLVSKLNQNADSWDVFTNKSPFGKWQIKVRDAANSNSFTEVESLFQGDKLTDIVLIITFDSRLPDWPF